MDTQALALLTCSVSIIMNACFFGVAIILLYIYDKEAVLEYLYNKK